MSIKEISSEIIISANKNQFQVVEKSFTGCVWVDLYVSISEKLFLLDTYNTVAAAKNGISARWDSQITQMTLAIVASLGNLK